MTTTTTTPAKFEAGRRYTFNSIGDSNCWWTIEITRRTAKSVWFVEVGREDQGEKRRAIKADAWDGSGEWFLPFGSYSMAPTCTAAKVVEDEPAEEPATTEALPQVVTLQAVKVATIHAQRDVAKGREAAAKLAIGSAYWFDHTALAPAGGCFDLYVITKGIETELEATQTVLEALSHALLAR